MDSGSRLLDLQSRQPARRGIRSGWPAWGSVSAEIIDPVGGVFWYAYGWPCGEAPEHGDQMLQERAWGRFLGFPVAGLPEGDYTTLTGELTHLAARHLDRILELDRATGEVSPGRAAA